MPVILASRSTAQSERFKTLADSVTGRPLTIALSVNEARHRIRQQHFETLIFDFDSLDENEAEAIRLLEDLPDGRQVRRLIFLSSRGLPVCESSVTKMLLACHCDPCMSDQQMRYLLSGHDSHNSLRQFRELSQFRVEYGDGSAWTYMPKLHSMLAQLRSVAQHDVTILLIGETGCGKTHLANLIHRSSPRHSDPFATVACGALPKDLIESELFGHVRGAFTGADRNKVGRFEATGRGTLLLDEVDTLSPSDQSKLLHIVETGQFQPVGSSQTRVSEARLVVASNLDLRRLVAEDRFRSDLFYRLSTLEFRIPPLRERMFDILPLAAQFIRWASLKHNVPIRRAEPEFLHRLQNYSWPGNIRELQNQMRRVVLLASNGLLKSSTLSPDIMAEQKTKRSLDRSTDSQPGDLRWDPCDHQGKPEKEFLQSALAAHDNNRSATARSLGISRFGLYKKLERVGLHTPLAVVER